MKIPWRVGWINRDIQELIIIDEDIGYDTIAIMQVISMTNQEIPHQAIHSQQAMSQEQLRKLLKEFKKKCGAKFHLTALGYFGSYARGEARLDSDVDIVFETTDPDLFMTSIMKQDLEAWLNCSVDVIRLHPYLHPKFKARIEHEIIYV